MYVYPVAPLLYVFYLMHSLVHGVIMKGGRLKKIRKHSSQVLLVHEPFGCDVLWCFSFFGRFVGCDVWCCVMFWPCCCIFVGRSFEAFRAFLNFSMLQAWFPKEAEIWNQPTWFLSALTFSNLTMPTLVLPQVANLSKNLGWLQHCVVLLFWLFLCRQTCVVYIYIYLLFVPCNACHVTRVVWFLDFSSATTGMVCKNFWVLCGESPCCRRFPIRRLPVSTAAKNTQWMEKSWCHWFGIWLVSIRSGHSSKWPLASLQFVM